MIRHTLTVLWNERKSNVLIFLEFVIIFCIFWFCSDYLFYIASRYLEPSGYNIDHTYIINMRAIDDVSEGEDDRYRDAMTVKERLEKYPGVERVSFSTSAIPYGWSTTARGYYINNDSVNYSVLEKKVTADYFEVFRMGIASGRSFTDIDLSNKNRVLMISPNREGLFSDDEHQGPPVGEVKTMKNELPSEEYYAVIGITEKQKRSVFEPYRIACFRPFVRSDYDCENNEIVIRVNPAVDKDFAERFAKEMKEQLSVGPYSFETITSLVEQRKISNEYAVGNNLKSVLSVTAFLFINIFLAIIGTFWSRIENRRSEIGLRLALGSSRGKVQWQLFAETLVMLFTASIIGTYICINLGQSDLLEAVGIPLADYTQAGFGSGHYVVNYGITLLFLVLVSAFAVWYPAKLASKVQPAESLRTE